LDPDSGSGFLIPDSSPFQHLFLNFNLFFASYFDFFSIGILEDMKNFMQWLEKIQIRGMWAPAAKNWLY